MNSALYSAVIRALVPGWSSRILWRKTFLNDVRTQTRIRIDGATAEFLNVINIRD